MYLSRPDEGSNDERILTRGKANYAKSGDETAIRLFYADGVLHAQNDTDDGDSMLWVAKRDAVSMTDQAWRAGSPYTASKTHKRFIYNALAAEMKRAGFETQLARQAIRECIEEGDLSIGNSNGKRGYRSFKSGQ